MIDEVTKSMKAQLYDRISSPLFSSFLISWSAWNYKFILIVLSGSSVKEKLLLIDSVFPDITAIILRGATFPLSTALAIIFLYPYPARYIYKFSRLRHQELKIIQTEIDDSTPMTKDEARKLRREAMAVAAELEAQVDKHRLETTHLKERIVSLQKEVDEFNTDEVAKVAVEEDFQPAENESLSQDSAVSDLRATLSNGNNSADQLHLTDEAQELLLEATEDKSGTILHVKFIGGTSIQTNGKNQIPSEDSEMVARWEAGLRLLVKNGLVEAVGNKDELFQVSELGYNRAKLFRLSSTGKSEKEFAIEATARLKNAVRWDVLVDRSSSAFAALLQEYLDKYIPTNIAMKQRHQATIADRLQAALIELQALD